MSHFLYPTYFKYEVYATQTGVKYLDLRGSPALAWGVWGLQVPATMTNSSLYEMTTCVYVCV